MKWTVFAITLIFSLTLSGQSISYKTITIEPNLGFENYEHFKRLVLVSKDSRAQYIKGFEYEWGFQYTLRVKVTKLSPELSDGTRFDFELDKIISKTKMPDSTTFKLFIDPTVYYRNSGVNDEENNSLKYINDSTFLYHEEIEIIVSEKLKLRFDKVINSENGKIGEFTFMGENRIRLIKI